MKNWLMAVCFAAAMTMSMAMFAPQAEAASCPKNCVSWYDGCNTCGCKNGRVTFCTKRYCKRKGKAYCKKKGLSCPTCRTMRCRSGYKCRNIKGCGKCVRVRPKRCPKNCSVWYDGCNTCQCKNGRIGACTKRYCKRYTKPYCKKKACPTCRTMRCAKGFQCRNIKGCGKCVRVRPKRCPKNCSVWYDGCNTCQCKNGRIGACTKRYCKRYTKPYCKKKACPTCRTMRCAKGFQCRNIKGCGKCVRVRPKRCPKNCSVWYDGCNTCQCKNGRIVACTRRACKRYTKPYCKKKACPTCKVMRCRSGYRCVDIRGCGKCVKQIKPRACFPRSCKVWYDGCNTCQCKNGRIGACTKRRCFRMGRAYCKKR